MKSTALKDQVLLKALNKLIFKIVFEKLFSICISREPYHPGQDDTVLKWKPARYIEQDRTGSFLYYFSSIFHLIKVHKVP